MFFGSAHEVFDQVLETVGVLAGFCCVSQGLLYFCVHVGAVSPSSDKSSFILMLTKREWGPVATALNPQG